MILDTCALIFLAENESRLPNQLRERMEVTPQVYLSAISFYEVTLKHSHGRLPLSSSPRAFFDALIADYRLQVISIIGDDAMLAAQLPLHHRDPFDRLIIAQCFRLRLPVVTCDPFFAPYGVEVVW